MKITIEVSARHIHLSDKDRDILFGKDYKFKPRKDLSQTGQYSCQETVNLCHQDQCLKDVRVIAPNRLATQVEISMTDAYNLKIKPPVRRSMRIANTPGIKVVGPKGTVKIPKGVIIAKRHIHCSLARAKELGLKDGQLVSVKITGVRALTFNDVVVRVRKDFVWSFQIDIDEANAANVKYAKQ